jgi:hypothetical protein
MMDHPNIAKVLDAGATDTGRPYFVMELVRGIKITDYCDRNNLSTRERLDLFIQVCHAIQHAHQKGIIHRDIKPSNILVTMNDGVPLTKVIDFGIAKATHGKLTDQTVFTAFEQFIGTPAYMSPEQAEMSALDIDDIYSLGVLPHPADAAGQALIQKWIQFIRRPDVRPHAIFLSDYDMHLTGRLVQGVDVWLNTPRRPWEACGTSGMKVLVNGGINLSELDGWWAEAFVPDLGWALGDGQEHGSDPSWDAAEAEALYERLEREVIPEFYTRNEKGIPTAWVARMRESMARLTPRFSANRAVCEYTEQHYLPAAIACQTRVANQGAVGKQMVDWRHSLDQKWGTLNFGAVKVETRDGKHIIEVQVGLHGLDPKAVRVELYADGIKDSPPVRLEMTCLHPLADESGGYAYSATVPAARPPSDYTARVMPRCDGLAIPLEDPRIIWQH